MARSSLTASLTFWRALLPSILFLDASVQFSRAVLDPIWVYTVQATAVIQASPPQILLSWEPDKFGANSFTIYRKAKADTAWGAPIVTLPGTATNFTDV